MIPDEEFGGEIKSINKNGTDTGGMGYSNMLDKWLNKM
jgi:hypothetical protein